jgi:hypothetical protein
VERRARQRRSRSVPKRPAPSPDAVATRERDRDKVGYHHFTPAVLDAGFRADTPRVGLWIDTSEMTVNQTVQQHILDHRAEAIVDHA